MTRKSKSGVKSKARPGSLLSPEAMGGIVAGKGFGFQTRYAVCQLPGWLLDPAFHQLFHEGTGDFDVRFRQGGQSSRIHIQVKDHDVTPAECREAIEHFRKLDYEHPQAYGCFKLVCPGLADSLRVVENGLARLRSAKPFYDDLPTALAATKADVDERMRKAGLNQEQIDFIHSKVYLEIVPVNLNQDEHASNIFVAEILKHPEYREMIRQQVEPAFAELFRSVDAKRGATIERNEIEEILRRSVAAIARTDKSICLWVQNWTQESFDIPADYVVDWSARFDRTARRVPTEDVWNGELVPELKALKDRISNERTERQIRFRGRCALSTSIALGATFPVVGGWIFEVPQPPAKEPWRSDAAPANPLEMHVDVVDGGGGTDADLVLGLNIRGDLREDVRRYIEGTGVLPRIFVFAAPSAPGSQSIAGSEEAVAFARAVRELLGDLLKKHGIRHTRLFFYGPQALAIFLGQHLTSIGEVQLFEYQDPGYVSSCTLRT